MKIDRVVEKKYSSYKNFCKADECEIYSSIILKYLSHMKEIYTFIFYIFTNASNRISGEKHTVTMLFKQTFNIFI